MVTADRSHPEPHVLAAYGLAMLSPAVMEEIESHLLACEGCCLVLEERIDHSFLAKVKKAGQTPTGLTVSWTPRESDDLGTPVTATPYRGPREHTLGDAAVPDARPALWEALADHPRYVIRGVIGEGGMGVVFLAEHRLMGRQVALKAIKASLRGDPTIQARFQREVRANAQLSHPNIAAAHDAEQAGGVCFLAMEYVEGEDLGQRVERLGRLPVAEACGFAHQAAMGLAHAHRKGLIHRDVKPHNMRVTPDGTLKLLDFGLARVLHEVNQGATLTQALALMGTPDYIAPEQAFSPHAADGRADIYSLGCSLYHLLAGRPPFAGGTTQEKLERHLVGTPPSLRAIRDDVPAELEEVIAKMTAKAVDQRYQTAGEAAEALRPFAAEPRVKAGPKRRRWTGWQAAVAASVLFVTGLLGVVTYRIQTEKGEFVLKTDLPKGSKVVISQDGDTVSILDGDTVVVKLTAGKYTARIEGAPNGWELEANEFKLKRGGKEVVEAKWNPPVPPPPPIIEGKKTVPPLKPGELPAGLTEWFPERLVTGESKWHEAAPVVAVDGKGRFVVVWENQQEDGWCVWGQMFDATGTPKGPKFRISPTAEKVVTTPKIAMAPDVRFTVAWRSYAAKNRGIYAQRFTAACQPVGHPILATTPADLHSGFSLQANARGDVFICYGILIGGAYQAYVQRFDLAGKRIAEERVNKSVSPHVGEVRLAIAPDGRFAVAYSSGRDIFVQGFKQDGSRDGGEFTTNTIHRQGDSGIGNLAFDARGQLTVVWEARTTNDTPPLPCTIYLRRYDARWKPLENKETEVGVGGPNGGGLTLGVGRAGDSLGVWGIGYLRSRKLVAQYIGANGRAEGPEFPATDVFPGDQWSPDVAVNDQGHLALVWVGKDQGRIAQQIFVRGYRLPRGVR